MTWSRNGYYSPSSTLAPFRWSSTASPSHPSLSLPSSLSLPLPLSLSISFPPPWFVLLSLCQFVLVRLGMGHTYLCRWPSGMGVWYWFWKACSIVLLHWFPFQCLFYLLDHFFCLKLIPLFIICFFVVVGYRGAWRLQMFLLLNGFRMELYTLAQQWHTLGLSVMVIQITNIVDISLFGFPLVLFLVINHAVLPLFNVVHGMFFFRCYWLKSSVQRCLLAAL